MSSARSITAAANPPRAVYLDYPLGRTAGKPQDKDDQLGVMQATLQAFSSISEPGTIVDLPFVWTEDDSWKDRVMRPQPKTASNNDQPASDHEDDRIERFDTPQYQLPQDAAAVDGNCPTCIFLEDTA